MPYVEIRTNVTTDEAGLALELSALTAKLLGKSEAYVMVAVESGRMMIFSGCEEPAVFLNLKSLGLEQAQTPELSEQLCAFLVDKLGVLPDRIYVQFESPSRAMWGWNGRTFA